MTNIDLLLEKFDYNWNEDAVTEVQRLLKTDRDLAIKLINELGYAISDEDDKTLIQSVFALVKEFDPESALIIVEQHDFPLSKEDAIWALKQPDFNAAHSLNKTLINLRDEELINDEYLFLQKFKDLDGKDAIRAINNYSEKVASKIFILHKEQILKRFAVAGQEESRQIKRIIELGILDEKQLKRAINRVIKQSSPSLPICSIIKSGFFSQEEIIELAKQKGLNNLIEEPDLPEFVLDIFVEEITDLDVLKRAIEKKLLNDEQEKKAIEKLSIEYLIDVFPSLRSKFQPSVLKKIKNCKTFIADSTSIEKLGSYSKEVALHCIDAFIETEESTLLWQGFNFLEISFITADQIIKIFYKDPKNFSIKIAETKLDVLKSKGLDKEFAQKAFKSVEKKELKKLSVLLADYLTEEDYLSILGSSVESVSGAIDYIKTKGKNAQLRKKALAKVANSMEALSDIVNNHPDLITDEEIQKITEYKNVRVLFFEGFKRDYSARDLLFNLLKRLPEETLSTFFCNNSLLYWPVEALLKIDQSSLKSVIIEYVKSNENFSSIILDIPLTIVPETLLQLNDTRIKERILSQPESFCFKFFEKKLESRNDEIPEKEQFVYKKKITKSDFLHAKRMIEKGLTENDDKQYLLDSITKNINSFLEKWPESQKEELCFLLLKYPLNEDFSLLESISQDNRQSFFKAVTKVLEENTLSIIKNNYEDKFELFNESERNVISRIIKKDPKCIEWITSNWDEKLQLIFLPSIDETIDLILKGSISPSNVPQKIGEILANQAVRERNPKLINLILSSIGLQPLLDRVTQEEEARSILAEIQKKSKSQGYYYLIKKYSSMEEEIFQRFPSYQFKDEISEFIESSIRDFSNSKRKGSDLIQRYAGRFSPSSVYGFLSASLDNRIKIELQRMFSILIEQGFESEILTFFQNHEDRLRDIVPKKIISKLYSPEHLDLLIKDSPNEDNIVLILKSNKVWDSTVDLAINLAIKLKYLKLKVSESYLIANIRQTQIFKYDLDSQFLEIKRGSEDLKSTILSYVKQFAGLVNVAGNLNTKTRILTTYENKTYNLNDYSVEFEAEDSNKSQEVFGLLNFKVSINVKARLTLSSVGTIICRIDLPEQAQQKGQDKEVLNRIIQKIEQTTKSLESDFDKILGKISNDDPFGIEMEFSSRIKRQTLAEKLQEAHDEGDISGDFNVVAFDKYDQTKGNDWEIKLDSSVEIGEKGFSAEVVSPKLYGEEGLKQLEDVVESLVKISTRGTLKTGIEYCCGLHVHHDMSSISKHEEKLDEIAKVLFTIQEPLYSICHPSRSTNTYCEKLFFEGNSLRFEHRGGFNLMTGKNTIEFRMREGMIDPKAIVRWVRLTKAIVDQVKDLFKKNLISAKQNFKNHFSSILDAIITEKALQLQQDKNKQQVSAEETYNSIMFSSILLDGDLK